MTSLVSVNRTTPLCPPLLRGELKGGAFSGVKNPAAETAGRPNFEHLFSVSFPQAKRIGNPSERFRTSRNDRNLELRQRPQGVLIINFIFILVSFLLFTIHFSLFTVCYAEDPPINITSDNLEYLSETKTYIAKGSVVIKKEDAVIKSDEATYNEETSDIVAEGNFRYDDKDITIIARKGEMDMESKTGKFYDAEIHYRVTGEAHKGVEITKKKDVYYISGKEIEKIGDNHYYSPEAVFTTCDSPLPAWCFKGKKVDIVLGETLKASNATFRIKDIPVLYTPYLWSPINTERQTGFLMPVISNSSSRGFGLNIPFFWAISENRDATFFLDTYTKRGTGLGMEYRFVEPNGIKSNWWAYHIRDKELDKDFWEIRALHENRYPDKLGGFLNINYVNEKEFYREFSPLHKIRVQRFLESTGELNAPFTNSRFYLLSQYYVDLKNDTGQVPQRLPEIGYVLNYTGTGSLMLGSSLNISNLWRKDGISARRLDIYPRLFYSMGKDFVVSQTAALRATAYSFDRNEGITDDTVKKLAFEYNIAGRIRLYRKYSSLTHIIEPSIGYRFITGSENNLPVFDSSEYFKRTSRIELSLLNRLIDKGGDVLVSRITQVIDTYNGNRPFLPLKIEFSINRPVPLQLDTTYDLYSGKFETISSNLYFQILNAAISIGQRYNRKEDITQYTTAAVLNLSKSLQMAGRLWYDAKGGGVRDMAVSLTYLKQCWGVKFEFIKKPGDFSMMVMYELTGVMSTLSKK